MPKVSDEHMEGRRRQIIDAAIACFARDGFHRATMQDICAEARLSPGAIYRHFPGKDAIVEAIADERHAREAAVPGDDLGNHALPRLHLAMQAANGDLFVAF